MIVFVDCLYRPIFRINKNFLILDLFPFSGRTIREEMSHLSLLDISNLER
jgi:hypothetical protein